MSDDLSGDMLAPSWPNLVGCRALDVKTTYGKSCAPIFWVGSDLIFDPSKVERGP